MRAGLEVGIKYVGEKPKWHACSKGVLEHTPKTKSTVTRRSPVPPIRRLGWCHWLQRTFIVLLSIWQRFSSSIVTAGCHGTCCGAWCQIIVAVDWWHHRFHLHLRSEAEWESERFEIKSWGVTFGIQRYQSDPILNSGLIPSHHY